MDHIRLDRDNCQTRLMDLQIQYDKLTNTCSMYEMKLNEQEERETELKLQVQHVREMHENIVQEKVRSQTEYTDAQIRVNKAEQALKDKIEEVENVSLYIQSEMKIFLLVKKSSKIIQSRYQRTRKIWRRFT
jgi:chromosome segregation ATPase